MRNLLAGAVTALMAAVLVVAPTAPAHATVTTVTCNQGPDSFTFEYTRTNSGRSYYDIEWLSYSHFLPKIATNWPVVHVSTTWGIWLQRRDSAGTWQNVYGFSNVTNTVGHGPHSHALPFSPDPTPKVTGFGPIRFRVYTDHNIDNGTDHVATCYSGWVNTK